DSLMPPGSKLEDYSDVRVKPFLNNIKDIARIKGMKFDFVVGNPPYVRVDNISRDMRTMYKSAYNWLLIGKWDIYIPFIYKGIEWLNSGDTFGYIVSNKFFLLESGLQLRKYILENCTIERITDVCGVSVFAGSLPAATIIIVKKEKPLENHKIKVSILKNTDIPKELEEETKQLKKLTKLEKILKHLLKNSRSYNVTQNEFKKDPDLLFTVTIPNQLTPLIEKIEKECESFGEICNSNITEGDTIREEENM
ncbi:Eco57I restriction-modification methylase domain-containing protein, partial [candidate division WOR-3 bacterium]|nr:Eco57I restriction-modification methylase domain-containing protein [candidate division WOR-3 bacterium]